MINCSIWIILFAETRMVSIWNQVNIMTQTRTKTDNRTTRLNIRLSDNMVDRLQVIAENMGIPPSTLAALAVSEYVTGKERQVQQIEAIANASASVAESAIEQLMTPENVALMASAMSEGDEGQLRLESV